MSRAYRVRVKESINRSLRGSDEICTELEILEILPPEQMGELLRGALRERGFEEEDGKMVRKDGDMTVTIDADSGEVSVKSETEENVELEAARDGWAYDDFGPSRKNVEKKLQEDLKQDLERRAEQQRGQLQQEATEKLEGHLDELQEELGQVVNEVTREALKRKAAQMGEVKEISEDPEAGSLTIKVEV